VETDKISNVNPIPPSTVSLTPFEEVYTMFTQTIAISQPVLPMPPTQDASDTLYCAFPFFIPYIQNNNKPPSHSQI